ncbi:SMC3 [Symbiodinium sp. KB8]|nr:SMC3 [Symbiodinium sp. KB8]
MGGHSYEGSGYQSGRGSKGKGHGKRSQRSQEVSTKHGLDAITMDGDKVSSRGTLTGGYQDPSRFIRLSLNQKMITAKGKVDAIRPRLVGLEQEVQAANNQIEEIQGRKRDLLQQRSVKRAALATAAESVDEAEGRVSRQEDALRQNQERCADLQSYIAQYEGLTKEEEAQLQQLGEELQDAEKSSSAHPALNVGSRDLDEAHGNASKGGGKGDQAQLEPHRYRWLQMSYGVYRCRSRTTAVPPEPQQRQRPGTVRRGKGDGKGRDLGDSDQKKRACPICWPKNSVHESGRDQHQKYKETCLTWQLHNAQTKKS